MAISIKLLLCMSIINTVCATSFADTDLLYHEDFNKLDLATEKAFETEFKNEYDHFISLGNKIDYEIKPLNLDAPDSSSYYDIFNYEDSGESRGQDLEIDFPTEELKDLLLDITWQERDHSFGFPQMHPAEFTKPQELNPVADNYEYDYDYIDKTEDENESLAFMELMHYDDSEDVNRSESLSDSTGLEDVLDFTDLENESLKNFEEREENNSYENYMNKIKKMITYKNSEEPDVAELPKTLSYEKDYIEMNPSQEDNIVYMQGTILKRPIYGDSSVYSLSENLKFNKMDDLGTLKNGKQIIIFVSGDTTEDGESRLVFREDLSYQKHRTFLLGLGFFAMMTSLVIFFIALSLFRNSRKKNSMKSVFKNLPSMQKQGASQSGVKYEKLDV